MVEHWAIEIDPLRRGQGSHLGNETKKCTRSDTNWKLNYVLKHNSYLDPQIKSYDLVDFTLT